MRSVIFNRSELFSFMFEEQQLFDLSRFCTSETNFSIVNIDTTFKLGQFYLTTLTFRNLSLYDPKTETFPTFFGPTMIHVKRDFETYFRFASEISIHSQFFNLNLDKIQCFITDDDEALHGAFKAVFKNSQYMLCCNHMRKNIVRKFNEFRLTDEEKEEYLELIFGNIKDRSSSLIASQTSEEYSERTNSLLEKLEKYKHPFRELTLDIWFLKYQVRKIYNSFTKIMWRHKSKVNDYYTTNDIEGRKFLNL